MWPLAKASAGVAIWVLLAVGAGRGGLAGLWALDSHLVGWFDGNCV